MKNYIAYIDPAHRARPLPTLEALQGGRVHIELRNIPEDVTDVGVVFFEPNNEEKRFAPLPCKMTPNGDYFLKVAGSYFPTVGKVRFEVVCRDEDGDVVPLGYGFAKVVGFGSGETSPAPKNYITEIADEDGVLHRVVAVVDEAGVVTWIFV